MLVLLVVGVSALVAVAVLAAVMLLLIWLLVMVQQVAHAALRPLLLLLHRFFGRDVVRSRREAEWRRRGRHSLTPPGRERRGARQAGRMPLLVPVPPPPRQRGRRRSCRHWRRRRRRRGRWQHHHRGPAGLDYRCHGFLFPLLRINTAGMVG